MANGDGFGQFIVHICGSVAFKQVIVVIAGVCPLYINVLLYIVLWELVKAVCLRCEKKVRLLKP